MATKFVNRPGSGVLKHNTTRKSDKSPDYWGEIVLDKDYSAGSTIELAGWKKPTPQNYLISMKITDKQPTDKQWPKVVGDDNDVPF